jgi:hypothetical protein
MTPKQLRAKIKYSKILASEAGIKLSDLDAVLLYFKSIRLDRKNWENILVGSVVDHWASVLNIECGNGRRRLGFLLFHMWQSARTGHWIIVHRDKAKDWYWDGISITCEFVINKVLNPLEEAGFIEVIKGDGKGSVPIASRFRPRGKLLHDLLKAGKRIVELETESIELPNYESIICRAKKHIPPSKETKWRSKWETHPTTITKNVSKKYNDLTSDLDVVNSTIQRSTISISQEGFSLIEEYLTNTIDQILEWFTTTTTTTTTKEEEELRQEHANAIIPQGMSSQVVDNTTETFPYKDSGEGEEWVREELDKLFYYFTILRLRDLGKRLPDGSIDITSQFDYSRIFVKRIKRVSSTIEASFDFGGRFYCPASSLPSRTVNLRDYILINGNPTVEVDFSAMHFRIAAAEKGTVLDDSFDPYWDDSSEWLEAFKTRRISKLIFNALINATSEASVRKLISINKDYEGIDFDACMKLILQRMPWMKSYLYTDSGIRLQNIDSQIANRIMLRYSQMTSKAILCYHDSFLVEQKDEELLSDLMDSSSKEVIGVEIKTETKEKKMTNNKQMTVDERIEQEFKRLSYISREAAMSVFERIEGKSSEEQLAIIQLELMAARDKQVQNTKYDRRSIQERFLKAAANKTEKSRND